jgi:hypothetical protein
MLCDLPDVCTHMTPLSYAVLYLCTLPMLFLVAPPRTCQDMFIWWITPPIHVHNDPST